MAKNGYLVFDFCRVEADKQIDWKERKTFIMTAKNIDSILAIDVFNTKPSKDDEGEIAFYRGFNEDITRVLKISRPTNDFMITYLQLSNEANEV